MEDTGRMSEHLMYSPQNTKYTCSHPTYLENVNRVSEYPIDSTKEDHIHMHSPYIPGGCKQVAGRSPVYSKSYQIYICSPYIPGGGT